MSNKIEAGIILVSQWGYDQTNVDFYTVVKRQGDWATVQKIGQQFAGHAGFLAENVLPFDEVVGKPIRRKVKGFMGTESVNVRDYASAVPWSGEPVYQSHTH